MMNVDWTAQAACRTADPDALFVQGAAQNRAKVICASCQVRTECLADALDNRVEFGVWGGMTERERRALLPQRHVVVAAPPRCARGVRPHLRPPHPLGRLTSGPVAEALTYPPQADKVVHVLA
jgi:hypothetical protein